MATVEEIAAFRLTVGETGESEYTDQSLSDRIDGAEDLTALAITIWLEKAARFAGLVDMAEGTSRRSLSQMQEHALKMVASLTAASGGSSDGSERRTATRAIERV